MMINKRDITTQDIMILLTLANQQGLKIPQDEIGQVEHALHLITSQDNEDILSQFFVI